MPIPQLIHPPMAEELVGMKIKFGSKHQEKGMITIAIRTPQHFNINSIRENAEISKAKHNIVI